MQHPSLPMERLRFFRHELGISREALEPLGPYAHDLSEESDRMAASLFKAMGKMAQTKIVLEHETSPPRLQANWSSWYASLWERPCDDSLLDSLWHSGLRHVNHGVDHRFITLAYSLVRRFSHDSINELVPKDVRETVHILADRLFDLCILVESDAYIAAQAHCSNDVMMGIAHQLRNPLTIIGGMASRMLRLNGEAAAMQDSLKAVLGEANRMERMMRDLVAYIDMLRTEPRFESVSLQERAQAALRRLQQSRKQPCDASLRFGNRDSMVQADPGMLESLLYHVLENAVEAQAETLPKDRPPSVLLQLPADQPEQPEQVADQGPSPFLSLEICNPGQLPDDAEMETLFQPFHSTKPFGTGLGLAIARLAAHKNFGTVRLQPWQEQGADGVCCRVTMVKAGHVHASGLFFTTDAKG